MPSRRSEICRRAAAWAATWTSRKADPELAAGPGRDVGPSQAARRLRDIDTVAQQGQGRILHYETVGQVMLGVSPENIF